MITEDKITVFSVLQMFSAIFLTLRLQEKLL